VSTRFVELSHEIENGMPAYPGIPGPRIGALLDHETSRPRYEDQAEFYLGMVEIPGNTGTYLDSPFHRDKTGDDLAALELDSVAGLPAVVVDAVGEPRAVDVPMRDDIRGKALLVRTGWDGHWGQDRYWSEGPYLSPETIQQLIDAQPALVGVDFSNVDNTEDPARPAHTLLLRSGILIVEHLCNLSAVPDREAFFYAAPLRLRGGASFPVRAFAEIRG
jgi:arylformamidase